MPPSTKIMVPIAFSPISFNLLKFAVRYAEAFHGELIVANVINQRDLDAVQVITSFGYQVDEEHYLSELQKQRVAKLEQMVDDLHFPEERIRCIFKVGQPAETLLRLAVEEDVDMIVMGLKANRDLAHAFSGSVAEKLFRRSPITIVSYRDEAVADRLRKRIHS